MLTALPDKSQWIDLERLRWAREFNVPMAETFPKGFPPVTLGVLFPFLDDEESALTQLGNACNVCSHARLPR